MLLYHAGVRYCRCDRPTIQNQNRNPFDCEFSESDVTKIAAIDTHFGHPFADPCTDTCMVYFGVAWKTHTQISTIIQLDGLEIVELTNITHRDWYSSEIIPKFTLETFQLISLRCRIDFKWSQLSSIELNRSQFLWVDLNFFQFGTKPKLFEIDSVPNRD